jgi:hypothetical protein
MSEEQRRTDAMLVSGGGIERVLGPHLQRIYKTNSTPRVKSASQQDVVQISVEARLAQKAREAAAKAPDIRSEAVAKAKSQVESGRVVSSDELAQAILKRVSERQV